jgi:hypothetical protein
MVEWLSGFLEATYIFGNTDILMEICYAWTEEMIISIKE